MYADDICLISDSPDELWKQLESLHRWSDNCRLSVTIQHNALLFTQTQVNTDKMKVVHFQKGPKIRACTIFNFKLGKNHTEIVNTSLAPDPFFIFLFFLFSEHVQTWS